MSNFHSILSIVAVIVIVTAGVTGLQVAEKTYQNMLQGLGKPAAAQLHDVKQGYIILQSAPLLASTREPISRGLIIGYWKLRIQAENLQARRIIQQNEQYAQANLRRYLEAQREFARRYGRYARDIAALTASLGNAHEVSDKRLSEIMGATDASTAIRGYYYSLRIYAEHTPDDSFIICAMPAEYGSTGVYTLYAFNPPAPAATRGEDSLRRSKREDSTGVRPWSVNNGVINKIDNQGQPVIQRLVINE